MSADIAWNPLLLDQLGWHWTHQLRPRLEGLTDEEYFFEPVPAWSIRRREEATSPTPIGSGAWVIDWAPPPHEPPPFTTIAWRLAHVIVGVFGQRNHSHFGAPPADYPDWPYAGTAAEALAQLDDVVKTWHDGVRSLGEEGLARPCGPAEGPFAESPLAELVLHIHREAIHHGAEISLLRDLHAASRPAPLGRPPRVPHHGDHGA